MAAVAWIASRTRSVGLLLAARQLARTPGFYATPVLLLILTLSLATFTASLAQTLDKHLVNQAYYKSGADLMLVEVGQNTEAAGFPGDQRPAVLTQEQQGAKWLFLPVNEHLQVPGVQAAARVGEYPAVANISGGSIRGVFLGIDRLDFPQSAFWRGDFAPQDLGTLMNTLALQDDGILAPAQFLHDNNLKLGDRLRLRVNTLQESVEIDYRIAGEFELFPGWYPEEDGPLFVGGLDYLFESVGWEFPYDVWLKVDADSDTETIVEGVTNLGINVARWEAPLQQVSDEQQRPERQGLFGVLSVGFIAAAFLTILGFLLFALYSFQRRMVELGILRACGLRARQMAAFLVWELAILIILGAGVGTALGALVSYLFIPFLQVGSGAAAFPPFVVEIAWPAILRMYFLFGVLFLAALAAFVALLLRMKIFQAIKLGEAT
jgi:putative ABC transport system permease protein